MTDQQSNPTKEQENPTDENSGQTMPENNPTEGKPARKYNTIKKAKSRTPKKTLQHNKIKQDELVKWTVFVQEETKTAVGKAVAKAGITVTDWVDSRLRQAATEELTNKAKPPAKVEDVKDILKEFTDALKADQAATLQAQNDLIEKQNEKLTTLAQAVENSQPRSLKELLFGKGKKD